MQTKKVDIKEKIKESAKDIFFSVAYKDASMRDVAAKSGMTVGNIYRYYENKEVLFDDILADTYSSVIK
ncbi:MAG: TetR/AcrR family transcriptional regulator, partial [Clostridia bacterium]|nr:TetR/AcrR family transcriptional regulator [Clostridia bacterium]